MKSMVFLLMMWGILLVGCSQKTEVKHDTVPAPNPTIESQISSIPAPQK